MAVTTNMLASWRAPRATLRRMLAAGPREDRALMLLMAGCLVIFVAQWPRLARDAELQTLGAEAEQPLQMLIGGTLLAWLFIMPIVFYLLAWLSHLACKPFGGRGTGYGARLALFWTVLVVSPLMLLYGLTRGFIGDGAEATLVGAVVTLAFLVHWALCLTEAEFGPSAGEARA
ncbi:YIP1 family protein [Vannielia litorea]|uniref:Yip1 domain-containing protein n=1 Tax=Vannielia litorea TaxID=1217970 RepID=A0A1N6F3Y6_9RHOB|nr:YIP1 family protein [Vannielia litorea]SIN89959.1 Yip1 domain-containing protein [Vannielia litorea]